MEGLTTSKKEFQTSETSSTEGSSIHSPSNGPAASKEMVLDVELQSPQRVEIIVDPASELPSFPEGGRQAWLTVLGG